MDTLLPFHITTYNQPKIILYQILTNMECVIKINFNTIISVKY